MPSQRATKEKPPRKVPPTMDSLYLDRDFSSVSSIKDRVFQKEGILA
jgi:hypothetical protein